jgi:hypothetical protein
VLWRRYGSSASVCRRVTAAARRTFRGGPSLGSVPVSVGVDPGCTHSRRSLTSIMTPTPRSGVFWSEVTHGCSGFGPRYRTSRATLVAHTPPTITLARIWTTLGSLTFTDSRRLLAKRSGAGNPIVSVFTKADCTRTRPKGFCCVSPRFPAAAYERFVTLRIATSGPHEPSLHSLLFLPGMRPSDHFGHVRGRGEDSASCNYLEGMGKNRRG